jgi:excisionase family DNA binding protein
MVRVVAGRFGDLMEIAISIIEAARRAGVGRSSVYEAIGRGDLKIRKNGRRSLVLVDDLKAWVSAMPEAKHRNAA